MDIQFLIMYGMQVSQYKSLNNQILFCSDFLPGAGPLLHLTTPHPSDRIRIETGVRQGWFLVYFL